MIDWHACSTFYFVQYLLFYDSRKNTLDVSDRQYSNTIAVL